VQLPAYRGSAATAKTCRKSEIRNTKSETNQKHEARKKKRLVNLPKAMTGPFRSGV